MDYDKTAMPAVYDAGRGYSPELMAFWLDTIASPLEGASIGEILDLGCGSGRFTAALAERFGARVVGVDPSEKMLAEARRKGGANVRFLSGPAESIPLTDGSVDMVFMSMVFHHFRDPRKAAQECWRVLRPGGWACLRAGTTDQIADYPFVPFIQQTLPLLESNLTSLAFIRLTFEEAGFVTKLCRLVKSETAASWAAYASKLSLRADSILIQLDDEVFRAGLAAVKAHAKVASGPVIEPIDYLVFRRD